jgi:signal transduction histidine kinase/streptogramin lyase
MLFQSVRAGQTITVRLSDKELTDPRVWSLAEDRQGNLWVGTANGAVKVAREGFTTYSIAEGLGSNDVCSIAETSQGELYVYSRSHRKHFINRFDGYGFSAISLNLSPGLDLAECGACLQDREGRWWLTVDYHLMHFPRRMNIRGLERLRPVMGSSLAQGAFILYEDSRGDVWMSTNTSERMLRWERHSRTLHSYPEVEGLPPIHAPNAYAEDHHGNLWIAVGYLSLARYSKDGFKVFTAADGVPPVSNLFVDSRGRLWLASNGKCVGRIDDPSADRLTVVTYTEAEGLSSNNVTSIVEDRWGRMYIGTDQGLDRLDLTTGRIKHFTTADGLANNQVKISFRDRHGALWFGSTTGVSRLAPEPDRPESSDVFINRIQISGDLYPVSELGESVVDGLELGPGQNNIHIGFAGLSFGAGGALLYQYKLEGADTDWTTLTHQREVNYASLAPGSYRFLVRAVNAEGIASNEPATIEFTILPPLWQRWWFLTLAAVLLTLAAYSVYRYRVARLVEVERIRTRIAADLHDDIGANLTKIGILSEVAHQQMNGGEQRVAEPISTIARISRESVTSMSDIVWAINPRMDSLRDLVSHMREFAGEMFASRDIEFEFRAPSSDVYLRLGADVRRTVYLIFKEAVNNAVRHAECTRADIELRIEGGQLALTVNDDGRGFERSEEGAGNGLLSMERRAAAAGGRVEIVSSPSAGTKITLRLPIKQGSGVRGKG